MLRVVTVELNLVDEDNLAEAPWRRRWRPRTRTK